MALSVATPALDGVRLPRHLCAAQTLFEGGFEAHWSPQSSAGSGGASGLVQREIALGSGGTRSYHLAVPTGIDLAGEGVALPLVVALHGAAGAGLADQAAQSTRNLWSDQAQTHGFMVIAPAASGSQGGWVPSIDFAQIDSALEDALLAYPVDTTRIHLWGFSAGGHVAHALALQRDPQRYAGYAINAGALDAYAGASAPAFAIRHTPLSLRVGNNDPLLDFVLTDQQRFISAGWTLGHDLQLVVFAGGHALSAADPAAHWAFLCPLATPL
jgi:poly(3-hydroxybutyrate) depolymerase